MSKTALHNAGAWLRKGVVAVAALATLGLFVFVHPPRAGDPTRTNIILWHAVGSDESEPPIPRWFNEEQNEIRLTHVGLPLMEIEQKFLTSAVGNIPPDLFEFFGSVVQWSSRGALMPLDELIERDGLDRSAIFPALWDEMMFDGRTYAIPTGTACDAFYWNKEHFRQAGLDPERPPATWDELEEYAKKLTVYAPDGSIERAGYIPGYWSAFPSPLFLNWPLQKGARFLSADGRHAQLNTPACVEAFEWEARLFKELGRDQLIRLRASFGYGSQHGFLSGRVSMIVQKSSFVQELSKFGPNVEYGASMLPVPKGGQPAAVTGPVWIGIPAGAAHPDEAWEYIKFMASDAVQMRNARYMVENDQVAFFPANMKAARSPEQMSIPFMDVFVRSMDYGHSSTVAPLAHTVFWRALPGAWDAVMRGAKTAHEALAEAQREVQTALDSQLAYNDFYREYLHRKNQDDRAKEVTLQP